MVQVYQMNEDLTLVLVTSGNSMTVTDDNYYHSLFRDSFSKRYIDIAEYLSGDSIMVPMASNKKFQTRFLNVNHYLMVSGSAPSSSSYLPGLDKYMYDSKFN
eukprot:TRINITY_DN107753_c0_g1_i1.p1 TRINITY_DN107753_c0_g1~~TRINITY_DN107753_c0_g1_i1.p1  ORF type:complete len:102 (+),score=19.94 TRINITY_DN107753_c0_g1_i1:131-436(+)